MAEGYFSSGEGGSPNAAADFRQLNALNPQQFSGRGLFDKLFNKAAPAAQPAAQAAAPQAVTPAITSAPSLVARVLKDSQPAPVAPPQMPPTGPHGPMAPGRRRPVLPDTPIEPTW